MRTVFLSILLLLIFNFSYSQTLQRVNSADLINKGNALYDEGKYKEAITFYKQVPRNDSNYVWSLYELATAYLQDSNYTQALQTCEKAFSADYEDYELDLLSTYASTYDDMGMTERAVKIYDSALLKFPNSNSLLLNKGITYIRLKKTDEATALFQKILVQDPYYSSAHYWLAQCAFEKGQLVPGMYSLFTYLILKPAGMHQTKAVKLLDNISRVTDDVTEMIDNRKGDNELFSATEQIILSKIALDKNYKLESALDDPIFRQLQVLIEKSVYNPASTNFWMQFYVPFFESAKKAKHLEPLLFTAFSNINIDPIQRYIKKNGKELKTAATFAAEYFNQLRTTRELQYVKRANAPLLYHFNDNGTYAGKGTIDAKNRLVGPWEFCFANGNLKSKGTFDAEGKKNGDWIYYFQNGRLSGADNWINGKQTGEDLIYSNKGVLTSKSHFKNGLEHGEKKIFYGLGHLYSTSTYKDGKQEGMYLQYYSSGRKRIEAGVKDDNYHGNYTSYYQNGQPEVVTTYVNGKLHGTYTSYYDNGQKSFTGTYVNGEIHGAATAYHRNGQVKRTNSFDKDNIQGEELEYNDANILVQKITYEKGKAQGLAEYYDSDGKLFSTFDFDKNILKTARYFNKEGKETNRSERQSKQIELTVYNPQGFKVSTTTYNDAADKINGDVHYYTSGKIKETNTYKTGKLHGMSTGYHLNGSKSYEIPYVDDEKQGLSRQYYAHGTLQSQGWYDNGQLNDDWINYNEAGTITDRTTYNNNDITGVREIYSPNGNLQDEEQYKNGWLLGITQYDSTGKIINTIKFKNGSGPYRYVHFNGKTKHEGTYLNGDFHGVLKSFYFDGKPFITQTFDNGLLEGDYTVYHYGGKLATSGQYKSDEKAGTWKYYTEEGNLWKTETYIDGALNGTITHFYKNGKAEREITYKEGNIDGTLKRYAEDGQLSSIFYYKDDEITGYTYQNKAGELLPVTPLPGGNGKVKTYYSNGNLSTEMEYVAGKLIGAYKLYYPNGKLYYQSNEEFSLTHDNLLEYYSNGNLKKEYAYAYNNENGPFKEYHENGKLKEEGYNYLGYQHGITRYYNADGKLIETRTYYYGNLLNSTK